MTAADWLARARAVTEVATPGDTAPGTMLPAAVAAIEAVLALHKPVWDVLGVDYRCAGCGAVLTDAAPNCPTVAALDGLS